MKKTAMITLVAIGLASVMALPAHANDGVGVHVNYESGVKVYRGAPTKLNHHAIAQYKSLELQERQIVNQNRQAAAQLNAQTRLNQDRLDLDRRIAFTQNEIFTNQNGRNNRRFVSGGLNNRFFGVNGISRNTRISKSFK